MCIFLLRNTIHLSSISNTILSKSWKHVWTAVPVQGFNTILFGSVDDKKNLGIQRKLQDFYIFVKAEANYKGICTYSRLG